MPLSEPGLTELTCEGCGSTFRITPQETTHRKAVLPEKLGRFVVLDRLGRGAFGTVYKARDPDLNREVAVKVPHADQVAGDSERARVLKEARAAAQLKKHDNIVAVFAVETDGDTPLIVSEFIDGVTLADRLTAGRPNFREAVGLIAALADALDHAHRSGVVHRDVKPANVLLDNAGKPHLADFGLARRDDPEFTVSMDGNLIGTPAYMSPEQAAGNAAVDGRADVYSLGVMLYELLAGERPFRGNIRMMLKQVQEDDPRPPRKVNDLIPRDLETVCLKCLGKSPAKRYPTAGELAADLRRWLEGKPVLARRAGPLERGWRWCRRNPVVAALWAAVFVSLTTGAAAAGWYAVKHQRTADRLDASLKLAERREGELALDRAQMLCERGEVTTGLLWFARGLDLLERNQGGEADLRYARLQLSAWGQHLAPHRIRLAGPEHASPQFILPGHGVTAQDPLSLGGGRLTVPGGRAVLARLGGDLARFDATTGALLTRYRHPPVAGGTRNTPRTVAFGADRKELRWMVTEGGDGVYRVWDLATGELRREFGGAGSDALRQPLWSPTATQVLSSGPDGKGLVLRDTFAKRVIDLYPGAESKDLRASFSQDGRVFGVLRAAGEIDVWETQGPTRLITLRPPGRASDKPDRGVVDFAVRPDGREVVAGTFDGGIHRWSEADGWQPQLLVPAEFLRPRGDGVASLHFIGDGRWLMLSFWHEATLRGEAMAAQQRDAFWEWPAGRMWDRPLVPPYQISPRDRVGLDKRGQLLDLATGKPIGRPLPKGHWFLGYAAGGAVLLASYPIFVSVDAYDPPHPSDMQAWDTGTGRPLGPTIRVKDLDWDAEDTRLVLAMRSPEPGGFEGIEFRDLRPLLGAPERITLWVQLITGLELNEAGNVVPLPADVLAERRRRLDELGGSPLPP